MKSLHLLFPLFFHIKIARNSAQVFYNLTRFFYPYRLAQNLTMCTLTYPTTWLHHRCQRWFTSKQIFILGDLLRMGGLVHKIGFFCYLRIAISSKMSQPPTLVTQELSSSLSSSTSSSYSSTSCCESLSSRVEYLCCTRCSFNRPFLLCLKL